MVLILLVIAVYRMAIGTLSVRETARVFIRWEKGPPMGSADETEEKPASSPTASTPSDTAVKAPLWSSEPQATLQVPVAPEPLSPRGDPQAPRFHIKWESLDETPLPTPLSHFSAIRRGHLIYVVGGRLSDGVASADVFIFDPKRHAITRAKPLSTPRWGLSLVAVQDSLYAIGGTNGNSLDTVDEFTPGDAQWHALDNRMPTARNSFPSVVWKDLIYTFGGDFPAAEVLDTRTRKWTKKTDIDFNAAGAYAVFWRDRLYLLGGIPPVVYCDPRILAWQSATEDLQPHRAEVAYATREDGTVFAIGGSIKGAEVRNVDACQSPGEKWWPLQPLPAKRRASAAVVFDDKIYVFGGMYGRTVDTIYEGTIVRENANAK
jgi:hypothetical protein